MPTDVASLITGDNYDAVINVPSTGETITEASEIDTSVALGNRIEYIYRRTPDLALKPEQVWTFREDFTFGDVDFVNLVLHADKHWQWAATGPGSVSFSVGSGKNPGNLDLVLNGASLQLLDFTPIGVLAASYLTIANLEQMTIAVKLTDNVLNSTNTLAMGIGDGTDSVHIFYTSADQVHWKLATADPSSVTNIANMTFGSYFVFDFLKQANGDLQVSVNGTLATTILNANKPVGSATPFMSFAHQAAGSPQPFSVSVDFFYVRAVIPTRSGP